MIEEKSMLETGADECEDIAERLQRLRPPGFYVKDVVNLRAMAKLLREMQRIAKI